MKRDSILKLLNSYRNNPSMQDDQSAFLIGICHMQLGDNKEARALFEKSLFSMFTPPMLWSRSNQPNWLVDICALSGRGDFYEKVKKELIKFRQSKADDSLVLLYSYCLIELFSPTGGDITKWIGQLMKRPKIKDMYAIGLTLEAILKNDQSYFKDSLKKLLEVHEGQAKHGDLRWSAEGLICMPAMSLALIAMKYQLKIELENEYLPISYLAYLTEK